ncbi:MAG TPA: DsrE family protein [Beijerinckiaceae bacterium]|nr:DsrE family protein [Beijerinckiaceae bacterium]
MTDTGRDTGPAIDRRHLIGALAAAGTMMGAGAEAAPATLALADIKKEADAACLYHCDFGDPARFGQMLVNIGNHFSVYGNNPFDVQLAVVAHGAGIKFFLESLEGTPWAEETTVPKIFERVEALAKSGLKVYLCAITFERQKIARDQARKAGFVQFVPSGVATVAALQGKGFAYLKVG